MSIFGNPYRVVEGLRARYDDGARDASLRAADHIGSAIDSAIAGAVEIVLALALVAAYPQAANMRFIAAAMFACAAMLAVVGAGRLVACVVACRRARRELEKLEDAKIVEEERHEG